jgi:hypothetical protein
VNIYKNTFIDFSHLTYYLLSIPSAGAEKTVVLHDIRSINNALLGFYAKAKTSYDCYGVTSQHILLESKAINDMVIQ